MCWLKLIINIHIKNLVGKQLSGKYFESEDVNYSEGDKKIPYKIVSAFKGSDLLGIQYEQLLPYALPNDDAEKAFQVIAGDFVTTEDGTGIVHIAPTFGQDDAQVAKAAGIPAMLIKDENGNLVPLVNLQGKFRKDVFGFAGEYVKKEYLTPEEIEQEFTKQKENLKTIIPNLNTYLSVDERITIKLKIENKAFKIEKHEGNIHVLNAPSPAATSCLAIADEIIGHIDKLF